MLLEMGIRGGKRKDNSWILGQDNSVALMPAFERRKLGGVEVWDIQFFL